MPTSTPVLRWLIRELIDALLRPVYLRSTPGNWRRFYRLLNACNCYPFCVEADAFQLCVLDEPSADYYGEDSP